MPQPAAFSSGCASNPGCSAGLVCGVQRAWLLQWCMLHTAAPCCSPSFSAKGWMLGTGCSVYRPAGRLCSAIGDNQVDHALVLLIRLAASQSD